MPTLQQYYSAVVPAMLELLRRGVSCASAMEVAREHGWPQAFESPAGNTVEFRVPGFMFYCVQDDAEMADHACMIRVEGRGESWDDIYSTAKLLIEKQLGRPHWDGVWPEVPGESSHDYHGAIWRYGNGLMILQQDDQQQQHFPELIGREIDLCVLNDAGDELPHHRRWRFAIGQD